MYSSLEGREGGHDSGLQRGTHTPTVTTGDSSIAQTKANGHVLIAKPRMPPPRPQNPDLGVPSSLWALFSFMSPMLTNTVHLILPSL